MIDSQKQTAILSNDCSIESNSELEELRISDLLERLPSGYASALEIGSREGKITRKLLRFYPHVTALDLIAPTFILPGCTNVAGDVTDLQFADRQFDVVVCTEVLEHVPDYQKAASELMRVTRHRLIVGVPYRQDTRLGRTTCNSCGAISPPWGHINKFDEGKLLRMFSGFQVIQKSFVGEKKERTNWLATAMMDFAGNPWGSYAQKEPCLGCGEKLAAPKSRSFPQRIASKGAYRLTALQSRMVRPTPIWIHLVLGRASARH